MKKTTGIILGFSCLIASSSALAFSFSSDSFGMDDDEYFGKRWGSDRPMSMSSGRWNTGPWGGGPFNMDSRRWDGPSPWDWGSRSRPWGNSPWGWDDRNWGRGPRGWDDRSWGRNRSWDRDDRGWVRGKPWEWDDRDWGRRPWSNNPYRQGPYGGNPYQRGPYGGYGNPYNTGPGSAPEVINEQPAPTTPGINESTNANVKVEESVE